MLTPQERAEAIVRQLGYQLPPFQIRFVADCIRAAVNDALEEAAVSLEAVEHGTHPEMNHAAELLRVMKG